MPAEVRDFVACRFQLRLQFRKSPSAVSHKNPARQTWPQIRHPRWRSYQQGRTPCDNQTPINISAPSADVEFETRSFPNLLVATAIPNRRARLPRHSRCSRHAFPRRVAGFPRSTTLCCDPPPYSFLPKTAPAVKLIPINASRLYLLSQRSLSSILANDCGSSIAIALQLIAKFCLSGRLSNCRI